VRRVFKNDVALAAVKNVSITFKVNGTDVKRTLKPDHRCLGGTTPMQPCLVDGDCENGTCPREYYVWVLETNDTIQLPNGAKAVLDINCGKFNPSGQDAGDLAVVNNVALLNGTTPIGNATVTKHAVNAKKAGQLIPSSFPLEVTLSNDEDVSVTFANILVYKNQPASNYKLGDFRNLQGVPESYAPVTISPHASSTFSAGSASSIGYLCVSADVSLSSTPGVSLKTWSALTDDAATAVPATSPWGVAGLAMALLALLALTLSRRSRTREGS
jgi:hypothetical protein